MWSQLPAYVETNHITFYFQVVGLIALKDFLAVALRLSPWLARWIATSHREFHTRSRWSEAPMRLF